MTTRHGWRSTWVTGATGITLTAAPAPDAAPGPDVTLAPGADVTQLVGLALRDNPRRAFLLVSRVLGKHVPVAPREAQAATDALAAAVRACLGERHEPGLVLGFAETATGLGHAVAVALGAPYLHSTRRPGDAPAGLAFDEAHSHARGHVVCPSDPALLRGDGPVVLVDDELSTGRTALNTIAALQAVHPRRRYLVAALIDVRTAADEQRLATDAAAAGVDVAWVALGRGLLHLPQDATERATRARHDAAEEADRAVPTQHRPGAGPGDLTPAPAAAAARPRGQLTRLPVGWPAGVREGGRYGITPGGSAALDRAAVAVAVDLVAAMTRAAVAARTGAAAALDRAAAAGPAAGSTPPDPRVLVLGTEELLHAPMRIAAHLEAAGLRVWFSSTTRSPAVVIADDGYPLRDRITFDGHDLPPGETAQRFAYNVAGSPVGQPWSDIVVVVDTAGDTALLSAPGGLLDELTPLAASIWLVVLPVTR